MRLVISYQLYCWLSPPEYRKAVFDEIERLLFRRQMQAALCFAQDRCHNLISGSLQSNSAKTLNRCGRRFWRSINATVRSRRLEAEALDSVSIGMHVWMPPSMQGFSDFLSV